MELVRSIAGALHHLRPASVQMFLWRCPRRLGSLIVCRSMTSIRMFNDMLPRVRLEVRTAREAAHSVPPQ